jgi:hypothetical protein
MELSKFSKAVAASIAVATPFVLMAPAESPAKQPGNRPVCSVGTAAYPTIQSAVDDTQCATIGVPAGTFRENVTISRNTSIRGEGPGVTIVDGSGSLGPVFLATGAEATCNPSTIAVTLEGMTITGGSGETGNNRNGGGVAAVRADVTVDNVIVTGNTADMQGGGISVVHASLVVKNSVVTNNTARGNCDPSTPCYKVGGGGGLRAAGCFVAIRVYDSIVSNNVSYRNGGGINVYATAPSPSPAVLEVRDSTITGNTAWAGGGGIFFVRASVKVSDTQISGNAPNNVQEGAAP